MFRLPHRLRWRRSLAAAALLLAAPSVGHAATAVESEGLATASRGTTITDSRASGGKAVILRSRTRLMAELDPPVTRVTLRVRAKTCRGGARMAVAINGRSATKRTVKRTGWYRLSVKVRRSARNASPVRVTVRLTNPLKRRGCRRGLIVDWISATGKAPSEGGAGTDTQRLYVDPDSAVARQADAWRKSRPADAAQLDRIASRARTKWLGGYSGEFATLKRVLAGASAQKARLVLTIYGIPGRDGGQYSAGGQPNAAAYRTWVDQIARQIGGAPTLVIIEPDAVIAKVDSTKQAERFELVSYAVQRMAQLPDTLVYLDAGNSGWREPAFMIPRLRAAGVDAADGIAVNVSNYKANSTEIPWGLAIARAFGADKGIVIDTGRNGRGPLPGAKGEQAWCNPPGRGLGAQPTMTTGVPGVDAYLWVKSPGTSDGSCNGKPKAGDFMPDVALEMARNAAW